MKSFFRKIAHAFKRHPILYVIRYILLSKNNKAQSIDNIGCFDTKNTIDAIPKLYFDVNEKMKIDPTQDEFEKALTIGKYIRKASKVGPGIGLSSKKTLETMLAGKGGVCSDFSQIFNVFCFINGIKVKEWGSVDSLYKPKFGHSFNEIYSTKQQKWIAIDIHKSILFKDIENNNYFSVMDLFNGLRNGNQLHAYHYSDYVSKNPERLPFVYSKITIPFLIVHKDNAIVDYYYDKLHPSLPSTLINFLLIIVRKNQTFLFVLDNYKIKLLPKYFKN